MHLATHQVIRVLKMGARAAIRIVAVLSAFLLASSDNLTWDAAAHIVASASHYAVAFALIGAVLDLVSRADRTLWRYVSVSDAGAILRNSIVSVVLLLVAAFFLGRAVEMPRSTLFIVLILDVTLTFGLLLTRRVLHDKDARRIMLPFLGAKDARIPLILVGRMDSVDGFLRGPARGEQRFRPAAIVSDGSAAIAPGLRGVKILPNIAAAADMLDAEVDRNGAQAVVFLDDLMTPAAFGLERLGQLRSRGVQLLRVPSLAEIGGVDDAPMREFKLEELLARPPVNLDKEGLKSLIAGKRILVTGAGGSIGSEICRQVASLGCGHLTLIDNSEFSLFSIDQEIGVRWPTLSRHEYLQDVRNKDRLRDIFEGERPDIVFHAAALKHVPLMERHPCESVMTNVIGTWNVAEAANAANVKHMVFISTDKAVDPPNVMGATKRLAEAVVRSQQTLKGETRFSVVRFGNVLGSAGSVVPTFRAQIERGGPVTLTHPDIERYFMTIPEAVQLVLHATSHSARQTDGPLGVFVLDMGQPVKIIDLARQLIGLYGKSAGRDIDIDITGLRPGEKLSEELVDSTEVSEVCDESLMRVTDRITGQIVNEKIIRDLGKTAQSGDAAETRKAVFDLLAKVRAVSPTDGRGLADVVQIKRS
ncbi:MAG: UDP-N-acetylglucosamine 4,6-dehydratase family protein [Brevundimonas sp.]|uniref:UDP-N-acetylglucosamine 4,6-dehydratase family protein n=1 Tax=Brevundimonas sp. TaxID=1871086 RepID=UPI004034DDD6